MGKIVSQKKFIKGVNAGTGVLTQPPGTVIRISNFTFQQRGSFQTVDGSAIIGQLPGTSNYAKAMGTFQTFASGQYPYYPTIVAPSGYTIPNIGTLTLQFLPFAGNPPGNYAFALLVTDASATLHNDSLKTVTVFTADTHVNGITASGWVANPSLKYSLYYMPGGASATQGVLIAGPTQGASSLNFTGVLPTTPLVTLPTPNNSYQYSLAVGNIVPPSKQVLFTPVISFSAQAFPNTPASVAPGDPNFQFQTAFTQTASQTGTGTTISATQSGTGSTTNTSSSTAAYASYSISSSQVISVSINLSYAISGINGGAGGGTAIILFQYSPDNGSTWNTFQSSTQSTPPDFNISQTITVNFTITGATDLANVLFRVQATATAGGSGSTSSSGTINSTAISITVGSSLTPYGGISGFASQTPQILEFNQLSILILGNGFKPQSWDPSKLSNATVSALSNTFQSTFPAWQASVAWAQGDSIAATVSGTSYQFTAQQSGVSGSSTPTFPSTLGATVADGQQIWKNVGAITTSVAPRGAAHGIVYAGSLWLFNTSPSTTTDQLDGPTCLKMSDSNNQNSWNPANVAFIGKDDGSQGTGMATFSIAEVGITPTQSLVCFKEFSTYQIIGVFGASDFSIVQAQTNLGCIGPRSVQFLPGYGIIRLTHMGFAIFNGVNDTLISEEIRPYLFGGIGINADLTEVDMTFAYASQSMQSAEPPMYICACPLEGTSGVLTRLFVYDLVLKAWTILDLPWAVTALMQALAGEGTPLCIAARGDGTGAIERMFAADQTWDAASLVPALTAAATPISWGFSTTHVYREGSSLRNFYRSVVLRGWAAQAVAQNVTVVVQINGNPYQSYKTRIQPQPISGQFELQVDLMLTAQNVQLKLSGTGVITFDSLDWNVTEKVGGQIMVG